MTKLIIAGSRSIKAYADVKAALLAPNILTIGKGEYVESKSVWAEYGDSIVVVSGMAPGVDRLGEEFAKKAGLGIIGKPAKWKDLTVPNCRIKINAAGEEYNALAGFNRNEEMAHEADVLLAVWDMESPGTQQMMAYMRELGKPVYKYIPGRFK